MDDQCHLAMRPMPIEWKDTCTYMQLACLNLHNHHTHKTKDNIDSELEIQKNKHIILHREHKYPGLNICIFVEILALLRDTYTRLRGTLEYLAL